MFCCRFHELLPFLLRFIKRFQKDGKTVVLVAHNASKFDVPFLIKEFERCSVEIPKEWVFVDSLLLAGQLVNPDGRSLLLNAISLFLQVIWMCTLFCLIVDTFYCHLLMI